MSDQFNSVASTSPAPMTEEANRLRAVYEQAVHTQLPAMATVARGLIRAWAEAETAIAAARRSGEPGAEDLPPAEAFRTRPFQPREVVSRAEVTRWRGFGGPPLDDETSASVLYRDGMWFVPHAGTERPDYILSEQFKYDRVAYAEEVALAQAPLLFKSLVIPGVLVDDVPGWHDESSYNSLPGPEPSPYAVNYVLDRLDAVEGGPASNRPERGQTVEYIRGFGVGKPRPPVAQLAE